ncbi:MAG: energy-coupling factor transporter ATPase [Candidatus Xenobiia bacterium LiM19]
MIEIKDVSHQYNLESPDEVKALDGVSLTIHKGDFVCILGHNGSGKSTLAKHMNALLLPSRGDVLIDGISTKSEKELWQIRKKVGFVFQNPDSQLVAPTVEEELAFGPENIGIPREEILSRIDKALEIIGLARYRTSPPHLLSGGQKQRVAIASVLTMNPEYLVLDEPTAMLDPLGQSEVLNTLRELNLNRNITVVLVTQNMSDTVYAKRVIVMNAGTVVLDNSPQAVFSSIELLRSYSLEAPPMAILSHELRKSGIKISPGILTVEEMAEALSSL